jgi:hypothetical protein
LPSPSLFPSAIISRSSMMILAIEAIDLQLHEDHERLKYVVCFRRHSCRPRCTASTLLSLAKCFDALHPQHKEKQEDREKKLW